VESVPEGSVLPGVPEAGSVETTELSLPELLSPVELSRVDPYPAGRIVAAAGSDTGNQQYDQNDKNHSNSYDPVVSDNGFSLICLCHSNSPFRA